MSWHGPTDEEEEGTPRPPVWPFVLVACALAGAMLLAWFGVPT